MSRVGRRVEAHGRVESTNDLALRALLEGRGEGLVVLAEEQTAGRGRQGRSWFSAPGRDLLLSAVLPPIRSLEDLPFLTAIGGIAVAEACGELFRIPARLRWPNDVVVRGRKAAGVLVESAQREGRFAGHVVGIGVNVNGGREDFPPELRDRATSLSIEAGRPVDRAALRGAILDALDRRQEDLSAGRLDALRRAFEGLLAPAGDRVRVEEGGRVFTGRILRASLEEGLWVQPDQGVPRSLRAEHARVEYL